MNQIANAQLEIAIINEIISTLAPQAQEFVKEISK